MNNIIKKQNQKHPMTKSQLRRIVADLEEKNTNLENKNKCLCGIIENHVLYEGYLEDEFFNLGDAVMGIRPEDSIGGKEGKRMEDYENKNQKCECWKCELQGLCVYRDRSQRHRKENGGIGKCAKLPENNGKLQY